MIFCHHPIINGKVGPRCFHNKPFTHLMADTQEELVDYAASIGMPMRWLQKRGTADVHFDCTGQWLQYVLADKVVKKYDLRRWMHKLQAKRKRMAKAEARRIGRKH